MEKTARPINRKTPSKPNPVFWIAGFGLAGLVLALILFGPASVSKPPVETTPAPAPASTPSPTAISQQRLVGQWIRPDGGYVLEIRRAELSGRLEAAYFNPSPINVSRAEWQREDDRLGLFVELRDVNYPGSTYKLTYLPAEDMLKGTYFQVATGESYEIEFVRNRPENQ